MEHGKSAKALEVWVGPVVAILFAALFGYMVQSQGDRIARAEDRHEAAFSKIEERVLLAEQRLLDEEELSRSVDFLKTHIARSDERWEIYKLRRGAILELLKSLPDDEPVSAKVLIVLLERLDAIAGHSEEKVSDAENR